jgi:hypothetical protein
MGCKKACYKYQCAKNREMPCINEIDPAQVVESCAAILDKKALGIFERSEGYKYERIFPKISGYTTVYNCNNLNIPYLESIQSMLGFVMKLLLLMDVLMMELLNLMVQGLF